MTRPSALLLCLLVGAASARGESIVLTTSQGEFVPGVANQGWWSETLGKVANNSNHIISNTPGYHHRNFFTFDLSALPPGARAVSATLRLTRFNNGSNEPVETIGWFDVTTDPERLNTGSGLDAEIFADLGGGVSYGEFDVPGEGYFLDIFEFSLNAAAVADINSARGGYFSVGGVLLSAGPGDQLFSSSAVVRTHQLVLEIVPEPSTALSALVLVAMGLPRRRPEGRYSADRSTQTISSSLRA